MCSVYADPTVKFLREALTKSGCPIDEKFFKIEQCSMKVAGGFKQDEGVRSLTSSLFLNPLLAVIVNILCSEGGQPFLSSKHCG